MDKFLSIINIDGTEGIGKTVQANMLAIKFRQLGIETQVNTLEDNVESAAECTKKTWEFLKANPEGIVINDGSIARMMTKELIKGVSQSEVVEKYREILHEHEYLNHQYGLANILIVMDEIKICHERILKRARFAKKEEIGILDFQEEEYIVMGLRKFDVNVISKSLKFYTINTDPKDSILEVQDTLVDYIEENFKIKRPSK